MLILIKSSPNTPEAKRALALAGDLKAELVLLQNAVSFARGRTAGFNNAVYALDEDLGMRGIGPDADIGPVKRIDYDMLVDLIAKADQVHGAF
jgi:sulfur relay protein TusB/DsrH